MKNESNKKLTENEYWCLHDFGFWFQDPQTLRLINK